MSELERWSLITQILGGAGTFVAALFVIVPKFWKLPLRGKRLLVICGEGLCLATGFFASVAFQNQKVACGFLLAYMVLAAISFSMGDAAPNRYEIASFVMSIASAVFLLATLTLGPSIIAIFKTLEKLVEKLAG